MEILLQGGWPGFSANTKQNYEVNTHNITYCDPPLTNIFINSGVGIEGKIELLKGHLIYYFKTIIFVMFKGEMRAKRNQ